jgi:transposase
MKDESEHAVKRWSARRKMEVVLRLFQGEDVESVSRSVGIPSHRLHEWRTEALVNLEEGFKQRVNDPREAQLARAKEQIGELSMENELLKRRAAKKGPLVLRRSRS